MTSPARVGPDLPARSAPAAALARAGVAAVPVGDGALAQCAAIEINCGGRGNHHILNRGGTTTIGSPTIL